MFSDTANAKGRRQWEEKSRKRKQSDKAWEILSALKGEQNDPQQVDPSFTLYLTEIIATRGHIEEPSLSRDMVNDIVAAMMKHGVGMRSTPRFVELSGPSHP